MTAYQQIEQELVTNHAQDRAHDAASNRISSGLRDNHFGELPIAQSDCSESPILLCTCRYTHSNAVDYIENCNQGNQCQKAIEEQPDTVVDTQSAAVIHPLVNKGTARSIGAVYGIYLYIRGTICQLHINDRVIGLTCETPECIFGADDRPYIRSIVKWAIREHSDNLDFCCLSIEVNED